MKNTAVRNTDIVFLVSLLLIMTATISTCSITLNKEKLSASRASNITRTKHYLSSLSVQGTLPAPVHNYTAPHHYMDNRRIR